MQDCRVLFFSNQLLLKLIDLFRYVDAEGNDYQPPYFPPPQFEQQNGQYATFQQEGQDGQFTQQAIIMNEDGQELLEEIDDNGQGQQQRQ